MLKHLNSNELSELRNAGHITENEIAHVHGDLLVAVNVLTKETRMLGNVVSFSSIIESGNASKRVLKG